MEDLKPGYNIVIDIRMLNHSGIGVYLKNLIETCKCRLKYYDEQASIYSLKEQILYFTGIRKCDIFWSPHFNIPLFVIQAKKRLTTIHDVYHLAYYDTLSFKQKIYAKVMLNAAVRLSEKIITVSDFSRDEIIRYTKCKPQKIQVIKNGTRQKAVFKDAFEVRKKYALPDHYILFVGNVKPHKNLRKLIEACLLLDDTEQTQPDIVIVGKKDGFITGDAELMEMIAANEAINKRIHFTGFVDDDDLDTVYRNAALFVFPSYYEGFGLPPLEAMLNECPVITSNAASMPEVCGDAAVYFDPQNAQELADRITDVLVNNELRISLIEKGRERVKMFTWERSAQQHIELINNMLAS